MYHVVSSVMHAHWFQYPKFHTYTWDSDADILYRTLTKGLMGSAPYIEPRLGGGPIFKVSVPCLYEKERPGKLPTLAAATIDFSLIQARYQSRARAAAILYHVSLSVAVLSGRGYDR